MSQSLAFPVCTNCLFKKDLEMQDTIQSLRCGLRTSDEPKLSEVSTDNMKIYYYYYYFLHDVMEEQQAEEEF